MAWVRFKLKHFAAFYRLDLNNPPVTTGGIRRGAIADWYRLDLNNPPVTTGGIRRGAIADLV